MGPLTDKAVRAAPAEILRTASRRKNRTEAAAREAREAPLQAANHLKNLQHQISKNGRSLHGHSATARWGGFQMFKNRTFSCSLYADILNKMKNIFTFLYNIFDNMPLMM